MSAFAPPNGSKTVGWRVKVYYAIQKNWFCGRVSAWVPTEKKIQVQYDDGDVDTFRLCDHSIKFLRLCEKDESVGYEVSEVCNTRSLRKVRNVRAGRGWQCARTKACTRHSLQSGVRSSQHSVLGCGRGGMVRPFSIPTDCCAVQEIGQWLR